MRDSMMPTPEATAASIVSKVRTNASITDGVLEVMIARAIREHSKQLNEQLLEALQIIADIAEGSTSANSLPNIARIAREAIAKGSK